MSFISFDDLRENPGILDSIDVLLNIGDAGTAHTGGGVWADASMVSLIRGFIARGAGSSG